MARIAYITDLDITGSGYMNLSIPLCEGLAKLGHDVKVIGLNNRGQEHNFPFSIIPAMNFKETLAMLMNFGMVWPFEILIVAFDIYLHDFYIKNLAPARANFKYIGIMPVEAPPLCIDWAMYLMMMDKPLIISQFGTDECHRVGIANAEYLPIGIDSASWRPATKEEKQKSRMSLLGIEDDETFIVLTVADNQERKNLSAAMEAYRDFSKEHPNSKYVLVTREFNMVGWKLRTLAQTLGISDKFVLFERGIPFSQLWMLYASADVFLLTSKAEGLGMPLLEAMSMKIPCIAQNNTGMSELLEDSRGILIQNEYMHIDPFGNGYRWWINKNHVVEALHAVQDGKLPGIEKAKAFVDERTWDKSVLQLDNVIRKLRGSDVEAK